MDTTYSLLIKKLSKQAGKYKIPLNGAFELTSRCNFNCKMCYIHEQSNDCTTADGELTTEQWIKLATEARDAGMLNLTLTGGEIFLRKDFEEIYENVARMGLNISLYTNASLIDSKKAKWLGRMPPTEMEITLYGASAETYEKVCNNANAYAKVVQAVDLLLAEGISIKLKTTATEDNINDYDALAEFSYKRGIPFNIVDYLFPARSTSQMPNVCRLTPDKMVDFHVKVNQTNSRLFETYSTGDLKPEFVDQWKKLNREVNELAPDQQITEDAFNCNVGKSDFWITWDGRMLPCGAMEEPILYPLQTGFSSAWKGLSEACSKIPACEECKSCELADYCYVCPAKLKGETGSYNKAAPYLCELAKCFKEKFSELGFNGEIDR